MQIMSDIAVSAMEGVSLYSICKMYIRIVIGTASTRWGAPPLISHGIGTLAGNSRSDLLVNYAKISVERICFDS
jgi:hypothetical protein